MSKALYFTALALWDAVTPCNSPRASAIYEWMARPHPGDHVIEVTCGGKPVGAPASACVGELVLIDWVERLFEDEGETYLDKVWTVRTADGVVEWNNCRFVRIPTDFIWREEIRGFLCKAHDCAYCKGVPRPEPMRESIEMTRSLM